MLRISAVLALVFGLASPAFAGSAHCGAKREIHRRAFISYDLQSRGMSNPAALECERTRGSDFASLTSCMKEQAQISAVAATRARLQKFDRECAALGGSIEESVIQIDSQIDQVFLPNGPATIWEMSAIGDATLLHVCRCN
jgi:hypothetical protein